MLRRVLESWLLLFRFEIMMRFAEFKDLHRLVRSVPVRASHGSDFVTSGDLCRAMDYACVFYFRRVQCLQRSCATTLLLRRYGWRAELVIGAQLVPFKSHAWVEINSVIVNDKPYVSEIYQVLERF
ncbi:lasso peptide biosynthesis B2 protein [Acidicapsa dinghuensis]|uniref:Lasso peptide biosynthesis B2 protein n=1 Tax=Acidicapsa dinghuensis TaxID=2218256 RepID=A0ABW1EBW6_9BACT|nr:lasso peptide biosynthesis B2 protein [Acidicapsa dinghuensis]